MRWLTVLALGFLAGPIGPSGGDLPEKYRIKPPTAATVVARVDGSDITAGDVEGLLWDWRSGEVVQELVNYRMVVAEAVRERADVNDDDVEKTIDSGVELYRTKNNLPTTSAAFAALAQTGMTRSRLYLRCRTQLLVQKMAEKGFVPANMVKVSTLIFRFADDQLSSMTDAINKANAAYDRLQKGDPWDVVFAANLTKAGGAGSKGLVGWRDLAIFPPSIADELKQLKVNQVTKPARTENGIQIFKLDLLGKDAKGDDLKQLKDEYMIASQNQLMSKLVKETKVQRLWPAGDSP